MGDTKPLGSEKLKADEKLKRILELTYYNDKNKKQSNKAELVKESKVGGVYGIVKEKDGYYVKKGLNEQSLDYIGGLFMKNKNKFSSYAEALKRMELLKGQEELNEATKYILKPKTNKDEAPVGEPTVDSSAPQLPPMDTETPAPPPADTEAPPADAGSEAPPPPSDESPELPPSDSGEMSDESKRSDYMAEVQKYAGKLGQELRDQKEKMESDDIKYVLNMIISAVDLKKLSDEDVEEIGKKFDRDEEGNENVPSSEEPPAEEPSSEEPPSEEPSTPPSEMGETSDPMSKLTEFINSDVPTDKKEGQDHSFNVSKYADIGSNTAAMEEDDVVELDMSEIESAINDSVKSTLRKYFK